MSTAIVVLIIITVVASLGAIIPQNAPPELYLSRFGNILGSIIIGLNINSLYHAWWFLALMALLTTNLIICSITIIPTVWKAAFRPKLLDNKSVFGKDEMIRATPAADWDLIHKTLRAKHYHLRASSNHARHYVKGSLGRLGAISMHTGFLALLLGAIAGNQWGLRHYQEAFVGDTIFVPAATLDAPANRGFIFKMGAFFEDLLSNKTPSDFSFYEMLASDWSYYPQGEILFKVGIDSIAADFTPSGQPAEYLTVARVYEGDTEIMSHRIEVNHPLDYRGFMFYQTNWGHASNTVDSALIKISLNIGDTAISSELWLNPNELVALGNSGLSVTLEQFIGDFVIDTETGEASARSNTQNNPAILLSLARGDSVIYSGWSFLLFPDFHGSSDDVQFNFLDYRSVQFTGLEITRHPEVPFVWVGFSLMILGLTLAFYVLHREIWIYWDNQSQELFIKGNAHKFKSAFNDELQQITTFITGA